MTQRQAKGKADMPEETETETETEAEAEAEKETAAESGAGPSDTGALRHALGCWATGVCVVTAAGDEGRQIGITVNSFTSVSLDPPLVLWSIRRASRACRVFQRAGHFTVSVLRDDAADVSQCFAGQSGQEGRPMSRVETVPTRTGPPAMAKSLVYFECATHALHDGGDHVIVIGRVLSFAHPAPPEPRPAPLGFWRGGYARLHRANA